MSFLSSVFDWFKIHDEIFAWLIVTSMLMLVISVAAVGWVIVRVPADYFAREHPAEGPWAHRHPLIRAALIIGKNVLGLVLVAAGLLMLVLPGQGVLTILAGLFLLDFPGRHKLVMWLVRRQAILNSLNWVRERAGREPFFVITTRRPLESS
jgi:hypothetical protein